jgi:hypothetical protein
VHDRRDGAATGGGSGAIADPAAGDLVRADYITELVDSAPPLSAETRSRLAVLLLNPSGGNAA